MNYNNMTQKMNESVAKVAEFNKDIFDASVNYFDSVTDIVYGLYNIEKPAQFYKTFSDNAKDLVEKSQVANIFRGIFKV